MVARRAGKPAVAQVFDDAVDGPQQEDRRGDAA
jgi:hypothetical protein